MEEGFLVSAFVLALVVALEEWYRRHRIREVKKEILRAMLEDEKWEWRTIEALQRKIRESPETTRELLLEIGATASTGQREVWTLGKRSTADPAC